MRPRPTLDEIAMTYALRHLFWDTPLLDDAGRALWVWRYLLVHHLRYRLHCATPPAGKE